MKSDLGMTRSSITGRHALISKDSHEETTLPGWSDSAVIFAITPHLGAAFTEYFAVMAAGGRSALPLPGVQRFVFVLSGQVELAVNGSRQALGPEDYAFLPAGLAHELAAVDAARLIVIEKPFIALEGQEAPHLVVGSVRLKTAVPMKGDERLMLQKLLPQTPQYDFEVNIMDFAPGASLPYVETHFMEHGLVMLNGGGIYRLDSNWYPVEAGDTIYMAPYCGQWFGAIGRENARYLIYKNWNRDPHAG